MPFLSLSASCLGSSVVRFAIHGCASSLLSTPGLRSVTPVRSPFLVPRHCAFPTFGRYDPATRDVATSLGWQRLSLIPTLEPLERSTAIRRFVSRSAGRHRATGLRHAAAIQAAVPSASALYPRLAASCRRLRRTSCASLRSPSAPGRRKRSSGRAVVPTACKCVLMASRLAVGSNSQKARARAHALARISSKNSYGRSKFAATSQRTSIVAVRNSSRSCWRSIGFNRSRLNAIATGNSL